MRPATASFDDMVDGLFDEALSPDLQIHAPTHFTPIGVARRAARMLAPRPGMMVLDVGSGVGKFCVIAATEVRTSTFIGVEVRPHLAATARRLAEVHAVPNARFIIGDAFALDWRRFDALYLFNPFAEHLFNGAFALDHTITLEPAHYVNLVDATHRRLTSMPLGTRLVTYHGYGVAPPNDYELFDIDVHDSGHLELWIKIRARESG